MVKTMQGEHAKLCSPAMKEDFTDLLLLESTQPGNVFRRQVNC